MAWYKLLGLFPNSLGFWKKWWLNMVSKLKLREILGSNLSMGIWYSVFVWFISLFLVVCFSFYWVLYLYLHMQNGIAREGGCYIVLLGPFPNSLDFWKNWWLNRKMMLKPKKNSNNIFYAINSHNLLTFLQKILAFLFNRNTHKLAKQAFAHHPQWDKHVEKTEKGIEKWISKESNNFPN